MMGVLPLRRRAPGSGGGRRARAAVWDGAE